MACPSTLMNQKCILVAAVGLRNREPDYCRSGPRSLRVGGLLAEGQLFLFTDPSPTKKVQTGSVALGSKRRTCMTTVGFEPTLHKETST